MTQLRSGDCGVESREAKTTRLNQLLNDPSVEMEADIIWALLGELREAAHASITLAPRHS
jgi:hypothetical protein